MYSAGETAHTHNMSVQSLGTVPLRKAASRYLTLLSARCAYLLMKQPEDMLAYGLLARTIPDMKGSRRLVRSCSTFSTFPP